MSEMHGHHVDPANHGAGAVVVQRILGDQRDRAKADHDDHGVAHADDAGSVKHALARSLDVTDGKEAHQDVRQAGSPEDQRQAPAKRLTLDRRPDRRGA